MFFLPEGIPEPGTPGAAAALADCPSKAGGLGLIRRGRAPRPDALVTAAEVQSKCEKVARVSLPKDDLHAEVAFLLCHMLPNKLPGDVVHGSI